jgi:hypothetical protein
MIGSSFSFEKVSSDFAIATLSERALLPRASARRRDFFARVGFFFIGRQSARDGILSQICSGVRSFLWKSAPNDQRVSNNRDRSQQNNQIIHLSLTFCSNVLPDELRFLARLPAEIDLDQGRRSKDTG